MNLYSVYEHHAEILQIVAATLEKAYYKLFFEHGIRFAQGMKIIETVHGWCEKR